MSKYSVAMMSAEKLQQNILEGLRAEAAARADDLSPEEAAGMNPEAFRFVQNDMEEAERSGYSNYSYWRSTLRAFFKNKLAVVTLTLIIIILAFSMIQPYLPAQRKPTYINYRDDGTIYSNQAPGNLFWLGTNSIGQDLWARIWSGTSTSLYIGFVVAIINSAIGIFTGILWGYVRKLDFLFTELYNILNNIPTTIVLILAAFVLNPSVNTIIIAMCFTGWIGVARLIRTLVMIIRDQEFNIASRCLGTGLFKIMVRNLLPHLISVIMLHMAMAIPGAIGSEIFLTYIGLGVPLDTPSLGNLLNAGREVMRSANLRYQLWAPVAIIGTLTISFYLMGNAFADAADPKNHV
jgi:oligopeptide transport system permease protein